jgi:hypothetical protein
MKKVYTVIALLIAATTTFAAANNTPIASATGFGNAGGGTWYVPTTVCPVLQANAFFATSANVGAAITCGAAPSNGIAIAAAAATGQGRSYSVTTAGGSILENVNNCANCNASGKFNTLADAEAEAVAKAGTADTTASY